MDGYLLDTNTVNFWENNNYPEHLAVVSNIGLLPNDTILTVSVVTLGEIEYGYRVNENVLDPARHTAFRTFIDNNLPYRLDITEETTVFYSIIRSRIFTLYPPIGRDRTRPEQCIDPATSLSLGIQENDLWITAQAAERNLVLVTHDGMARIRSVIDDLVRVEDWTIFP
jgi:predicted nucleic acid-binding protein